MKHPGYIFRPSAGSLPPPLAERRLEAPAAERGKHLFVFRVAPVSSVLPFGGQRCQQASSLNFVPAFGFSALWARHLPPGMRG